MPQQIAFCIESQGSPGTTVVREATSGNAFCALRAGFSFNPGPHHQDGRGEVLCGQDGALINVQMAMAVDIQLNHAATLLVLLSERRVAGRVFRERRPVYVAAVDRYRIYSQNGVVALYDGAGRVCANLLGIEWICDPQEGHNYCELRFDAAAPPPPPGEWFNLAFPQDLLVLTPLQLQTLEE